MTVKQDREGPDGQQPLHRQHRAGKRQVGGRAGHHGDALQKSGPRGIFRPIIPTAQKRDNDIELILQRYHLDQTYYETFAFTRNAVQSLSTGSLNQGILKQIVERYRSFSKNSVSSCVRERITKAFHRHSNSI